MKKFFLCYAADKRNSKNNNNSNQPKILYNDICTYDKNTVCFSAPFSTKQTDQFDELSEQVDKSDEPHSKKHTDV